MSKLDRIDGHDRLRAKTRSHRAAGQSQVMRLCAEGRG
jgi:hypothetical protein